MEKYQQYDYVLLYDKDGRYTSFGKYLIKERLDSADFYGQILPDDTTPGLNIQDDHQHKINKCDFIICFIPEKPSSLYVTLVEQATRAKRNDKNKIIPVCVKTEKIPDELRHLFSLTEPILMSKYKWEDDVLSVMKKTPAGRYSVYLKNIL